MSSKDWIAGAIKPANKGKFSAAAKKAGESTAAYADEKSGAKGVMGRRARLAQTLMAMRKK